MNETIYRTISEQAAEIERLAEQVLRTVNKSKFPDDEIKRLRATNDAQQVAKADILEAQLEESVRMNIRILQDVQTIRDAARRLKELD